MKKEKHICDYRLKKDGMRIIKYCIICKEEHQMFKEEKKEGTY